MDRITHTPDPPYTAVIFTSVRTHDDAGYAEMLERMVRRQAGYLGHDACYDDYTVRIATVDRAYNM